ncbi:MAG: energy-coupling factor transporter transmembrane component T [Eubacteriales bacterium]|nr:energy-coupling factor transporter transmembrane component T [Eubacteriales bacterium]
MVRDITIGQYYAVDSPVHRLDPRAKILLTIAYIVAVFMVKNLLAYLPIVAFLLFVSNKSRIPIKMLLRGIKPIRILLLFTFVLNMFFGAGERVLFEIGSVQIKYEGLMNAVHFTSRLVLLVMGTSILTLTTPPVVLTDGLETLTSPLKKIGFPSHEMAMMMTIALRFIPTLIEEADKIMKAQTARGADFSSGNLRQRAKAMVPLLVPLFISAFRRAGDLAMAMESRCYHGGEGRTRLHVLKFKKADMYAALSFAVLFALIIIVQKIPILL